MVYQDGYGGRVCGDGSGAGKVPSFADVERQMVEAMELWQRTPGEGRWPFAGDGPWHLVTPDASEAGRAEFVLNAEREGKAAAEAPRRLPLSLEEVRRRDAISEWLRLAPEQDRRLVTLVLARYARGDKQIKWKRIREQLIRSGEPAISARGLGMRYSRAITAIARSLKMADFWGYGMSRGQLHGDENKGCSP